MSAAKSRRHTRHRRYIAERADEDERLESCGARFDGEHADHRADRMADEHDIGQLQLLADLEHVVGVSVERRVLPPVVGRKI